MMGMGESVLRIEKLENGYEVEVCDPTILAENEKPKTAYKSPWKGYAFTTAEEVKNFVGEHLDSLKPPPDADAEYGSAFAKASSEED
jgi:hypothetical protein